jgi:hypothetical protein
VIERSSLDEGTLRETKADVTSRLVEQAKITPDALRTGLGIDPTSIGSIEDYVGKVLRKAEVNHVELQREDRARSIKSVRDPLRSQPRHAGNQLVTGEAEVPRVVTEGANIRAARQCFAEMRELAIQHGDTTWSQQLDSIKAGNLPTSFQDKQLKGVLFAYVQKHGDPRLKAERPVSLPKPKTGNPWRRVGKRTDWSTVAPRLSSMVFGK